MSMMRAFEGGSRMGPSVYLVRGLLGGSGKDEQVVWQNMGEYAGSKDAGDLFRPAEPGEMGVLFSYFYFKNVDLTRHIAKQAYRPGVFVDSGGFTAFTQGVHVEMADYVRWVRKHAKVIDHYANFDEIGDAKGTLRNQLRMEQFGLRPLPVIHYGADPEEIRRYHRRGYDYMCLGGLVPQMKFARAEVNSGRGGPTLDWLDRMHGAAAELDVTLHGFGVTTWGVLLRYPWRSVDSSSWSASYRFGQIPIFDPALGRWHIVQLRNRQKIMRHSALIRLYGCDPVKFVRDSGMARTRPESIKLAVRSWLVAQRYARRRAYLVHALGGAEENMRPALDSLTVHLAEPNAGYKANPDYQVLTDTLSEDMDP